MTRDRDIIELKSKWGSSLRSLNKWRNLDNETLTIGDIMLILLTSHTHSFMNTLMIRQEEEGIQGMTLRILKLRYKNLMAILTWRTILIGSSPWKIFELKDYNDEKDFKLVILKMKRYASLWYEHLKKGRAREAKSKSKTWSKFKKHMDKRFPPPSYK